MTNFYMTGIDQFLAAYSDTYREALYKLGLSLQEKKEQTAMETPTMTYTERVKWALEQVEKPPFSHANGIPHHVLKALIEDPTKLESLKTNCNKATGAIVEEPEEGEPEYINSLDADDTQLVKEKVELIKLMASIEIGSTFFYRTHEEFRDALDYLGKDIARTIKGEN